MVCSTVRMLEARIESTSTAEHYLLKFWSTSKPGEGGGLFVCCCIFLFFFSAHYWYMLSSAPLAPILHYD